MFSEKHMKKTRTCFQKKTYMFSEKHVRLFSETRTRIYENTYVFFQKDDGDIQAIRILYNKPNNQLFFKV